MRLFPASRILFYFVTAILFTFTCLASSAVAQEESDPCKTLNTPKLIKEKYEGGDYKRVFSCLAVMIEKGNYKASSAQLKNDIYPVLDHYFKNFSDDEYNLEELLWLVMIKPKNETGAVAAKNYEWSKQVKSRVKGVLDRFYGGKWIDVYPKEATIRKQKGTEFSTTLRNRLNMPLNSIIPQYSTTVKPEGWGEARVDGTKVVVTGLKTGKQDGTLVIRDLKLKLEAKEVPLYFRERMSILWPLGGTAITGGAAAWAATTDDDGTATTLWVVTGVSGAVTLYLWIQYLRGGGVPLLGDLDAGAPEDEYAFRIVPGLGSLELNVRF